MWGGFVIFSVLVVYVVCNMKTVLQVV